MNSSIIISYTFSFLEELHKFNLGTHKVFEASFDVTPLLTNVPQDEQPRTTGLSFKNRKKSLIYLHHLFTKM